MAKIEVIGPAQDVGEGGKSYSAIGTRILIDGKEFPEVRSVDLRFAVGEIVTAKVEFNATENFHFEGDASVHATITVCPGYELTEEVLADGRTVYRAKRADAA